MGLTHKKDRVRQVIRLYSLSQLLIQDMAG